MDRKLMFVHKPISFGNTVSWEGRVEQDHRYVKWTVYFRSACGDDLSTFISSITFQLHEDFKPKNRVCKEPPYEVTENGWGEFIINIVIQFRGDDQPYIKIPYHLHLLPAEHLVKENIGLTDQFELTDELIFFEPTGTLKHNLANIRRAPVHTSTEALVNSKTIPIPELFKKLTSSISRLETEPERLEKKMSEGKEKLRCLRKILEDRKIIKINEYAKDGIKKRMEDIKDEEVRGKINSNELEYLDKCMKAVKESNQKKYGSNINYPYMPSNSAHFSSSSSSSSSSSVPSVPSNIQQNTQPKTNRHNIYYTNPSGVSIIPKAVPSPIPSVPSSRPSASPPNTAIPSPSSSPLAMIASSANSTAALFLPPNAAAPLLNVPSPSNAAAAQGLLSSAGSNLGLTATYAAQGGVGGVGVVGGVGIGPGGLRGSSAAGVLVGARLPSQVQGGPVLAQRVGSGGGFSGLIGKKIVMTQHGASLSTRMIPGVPPLPSPLLSGLPPAQRESQMNLGQGQN